MTEEILFHPYKEYPFLLLEEYPGLHDILKTKMHNTDDMTHFFAWRPEEHLIQYQGWTCNMEFNWRFKHEFVEIEGVKLFKVCRAPEDKDQHD